MVSGQDLSGARAVDPFELLARARLYDHTAAGWRCPDCRHAFTWDELMAHRRWTCQPLRLFDPLRDG